MVISAVIDTETGTAAGAGSIFPVVHAAHTGTISEPIIRSASTKCHGLGHCSGSPFDRIPAGDGALNGRLPHRENIDRIRDGGLAD
jgi:hypothetical protein